MATIAAPETQQLQRRDKNAGTLTRVRDLLESHKGQIAMALPKHLTPERMIRVALTAVSGNERLAECEPLTIAASVVQASILGLEPNSVLGECYLIPYWNSKLKIPGSNKLGGYACQMQPGYQGLVKIARNSGQFSIIDAQPVHEGDEFDFEKGSDTWWRHKWAKTGTRGRIIGYWAGYVLKDGSKNFEYMTVESINEHRDKYSQGAYLKERGAYVKDKDGNKILQGPWRDSPDWMYRKTPLKQVLKLAPKSIEMQTALSMDERMDAGLAQAFVDVPLTLQPAEVDDVPQIAEPQRKSDVESGDGLTPRDGGGRDEDIFGLSERR